MLLPLNHSFTDSILGSSIASHPYITTRYHPSSTEKFLHKPALAKISICLQGFHTIFNGFMKLGVSSTLFTVLIHELGLLYACGCWFESERELQALKKGKHPRKPCLTLLFWLRFRNNIKHPEIGPTILLEERPNRQNNR